jgi:hypothetical protein
MMIDTGPSCHERIEETSVCGKSEPQTAVSTRREVDDGLRGLATAIGW